jgi:hypothetical protein
MKLDSMNNVLLIQYYLQIILFQQLFKDAIQQPIKHFKIQHVKIVVQLG